MAREAMEFDLVVVGGGPAGLATAIRYAQLSAKAGGEPSVCLVEKGSEIGAHILSGAVIETRALDELIPDWQEKGAPLKNPVTQDTMHYLLSGALSVRLPGFMVPGALHNKGSHAASLGSLCRWLGEQAEALGVMLFPGFAASEVLYGEGGAIAGVATGDMGIAADGQQKPSYQQGYELRAKYTVFAEGCRGHLGKELIKRFKLDEHSDTQHYGIGFKELWEVDASKHQPGRVLHTVGWPLGHLPGQALGGSYLYHLEGKQVSVGLIIDLGYKNPHLSPFDEFQRFKQHPLIRGTLEGGKRLAYGARAVIKGGLSALPKLAMPGGLLVGDDAGFLDNLKQKGSHTAMKSGMLAAEAVHEAVQRGSAGEELSGFEAAFKASWLHADLRRARNTGPWWHKLGFLLGSAAIWVEQTVFRGRLPFTLRDPLGDHEGMTTAAKAKKPDYPKPDGAISFDKLSSVFLTNVGHAEDQPCHLVLADPSIPIEQNLPKYDEPAQRYCPAGVYEVVEEGGAKRFQINAQNCIHCKTCDIKDPAQNINWVAPEGSGGPNYGAM